MQALANTAWAFAMAAQSDAELFRALARAAGWCVGDFHAQDLANTAWAFATLGQSDVKLFAASIAKQFEIQSVRILNDLEPKDP